MRIARNSRNRAAALALAWFAASAACPAAADAYLVDLAWRDSTEALGYQVYVRFGEDVRDLSVDAGVLEQDENGEISYRLRHLPVGPTTYFSVAAYNTDGALSERSNRIAIDYATAARFSDTDRDGLTDAQEDVDLDGIVDVGESDPRNTDTDGDGLSDGDEVNVVGSSPVDTDSDDDGNSDGAEVGGGTDPTDPDSFLGRCGDADGDGYVDLSDVLQILAVATYRATGCPLHLCDANGSGTVTTSDVLAVLATTMDQSVPMRCPAA